MPNRRTFDVAIIGAGVSGLIAAQKLSAAGLSIALIEARDRIGGRIHSIADPLFPLPVELGAEFIHSKGGDLWPIIAAAGTSAYAVDGDHFYLRRGRLRKDNAFWDQVDEVLSHLKRLGPRDMSFGDFVRTRVRSPRLRAAKEQAIAYVEGFDAAPIDRISARSIAQAEEQSEGAEGAESFRIIGGYRAVIEFLRTSATPQNVALHLSSVVKSIRWKRGAVTLEIASPQGEARDAIRAKRAIMTLPIGVARVFGAFVPPGVI